MSTIQTLLKELQELKEHGKSVSEIIFYLHQRNIHVIGVKILIDRVFNLEIDDIFEELNKYEKYRNQLEEENPFLKDFLDWDGV